MAEDKIAIRLIPTPATQDIAETNLVKLSRITKLPLDTIRDRVSKGKSIVIITAYHPKVEAAVELLRSFGFSVTTGPAGKIVSNAHSIRPSRKRSLVVDEDEWKIGDLIENLYEVRDVKQGGMGSVYVVRHRRWNTLLAVKSLLQRLRDNEEDKALFTKEAETWIDIGFHPNIAACYYVRNINDSPRIFIEYVDGGSLSDWLKQRRIVGWDLLLDLMVQVSDALQHAHDKGLVHRDVKPGNCLMTKDGVLKVTDFGLTKRTDSESHDRSQLESLTAESLIMDRTSITAAGMGTPGYMAPEMWIPHSEVGPRADIYAFGVMFFELCCGRKPFVLKAGETRDKLALAHVRKAPPRPRAFRPDLPEPVEEIILKCLHKNPRDRYPSFLGIRQALTSAYEGILHRKFTREPPDEVKLRSDALNNRAVSLMDLNHYEEAVSALKRALETDPHHPEAVFNLGLLDWLRTKSPDRELVMRMEEVTNTPEYVGRGAYLLAQSLLAIGDTDRAMKASELALSAEDATEARLKPYAIALVGATKDEDAIRHLETYLADFPNDDEALGWLIGAMVRTGHTEEAEARLKALPRGLEIVGLRPEEIADQFAFSGLSEVLVLQGHTGWVNCVSHFPKSHLIMSGSRDRTVKVWDSVTGEEKKTFLIVGQPPDSLWISPDERLAAITAAQSGEPVKVMDLESGRFVGQLLAHEGQVTAVGFSLNGAQVLTVESKGVARLWEVAGFKAAATFKIPPHTAAALVSADAAGPEIIIAGMDRIVKRIRPLGPGVEPFESGHREPITCLKASSDGSRVLTAARDRQLLVWDVTTGKIMSDFHGHQEQVSEAALNPAGTLAASCDSKGGIKVWDALTGMEFRTFGAGDAETVCLAFTPDGAGLISGGRDMVVRVWDVRGRPRVPPLALARIRPVKKQMKSDRRFKSVVDGARKAIKRGAFSVAYSLLRDSQALPGYERSDEALDLIGAMRDHGKRLGLRGGWKRKSFDISSGVMDVTFSPSAINFLTAQSDHTVRMWSAKTGDCLKVLRDHTNLVATVRYSVNGREAASGGDDRSIRIWELNTGRNLLVLKGHTDSVSSVSYSLDGNFLVSGSWDKTVRIWRLPEGTLLRTLKGHDDKITAAHFIHDSEHIISSAFDGVIKMWDVSTGRALRDLKGHRDRVACLSVSPAGDLLLSGSMDGTVRIWDLKTGACIRVVELGGAGVKTSAFSPDQNFFVTGGNDAVLRMWATATGECQREFQGHSREISAVGFSSNGRFVISASVDGTVIIWELDWDWQFDAKKG